jgi:hypothetical protein
MEFLIFAVMSVIAFLMLLFNQRLPLGILNGVIAGFVFVLIGIFLLTEGLTVGTVVVSDAFTQAIGVVYMLFGIGNSAVSSMSIKKDRD